jgi:glyceraldehyde 3-phosphate dehydrogenase
MPNIGINGFGRIGKCVFLQLLRHPVIQVAAINAPTLRIEQVESYLKYDSTHRYPFNVEFKIIDSETFEINGKRTHIFRNRNANELEWKKYNITYVIEATGAYLTTKKCLEHNVDNVLITAPPKDDTPIFVPGVNDNMFTGQKIVSNASCTTNCITPILKSLEDNFGIKHANFTTVHSTTASQTTIDTLTSSHRTHRSILNNIIPHSTGASGAIAAVIPSLKDKVFGTSLRVPVSNVSMVDLNIELKTPTTFDILMEILSRSHNIIEINYDNLVSSDFMTTTCPSIVDKAASMPLGEPTRYKIMAWYDNEWSYSAQVIRLLETMINYNNRYGTE